MGGLFVFYFLQLLGFTISYLAKANNFFFWGINVVIIVVLYKE